jgi:hypothetical protein
MSLSDRTGPLFGLTHPLDFTLLDLKRQPPPSSQQRSAREGNTFAPGELRRFSCHDWHLLCSTPDYAASASQNRPAQRLPMANSYLLETPRRTAAINSIQIATLIGSLSRTFELLTVDIEHEEARVGVRDFSDPAYPVLARSLRRRRENIRATIVSLENLRAPKASALDTTEREVA